MTVKVDDKVGAWRVLSIAYRRALCRCKCGTVCEVSLDALGDGTSVSCGCAATRPRNISRLRIPDWRPERGR